MKSFLRTCIWLGLLLTMGANSSYAQLRFGFKGGISTYDLGVSDAISIDQSGSTFLLDVQDARYGYHIGLVLQGKIGSFVLQPEVVFNSNSVDYSFGQTNNGSTDIFSEKYQNIDIPLMFGLKAGPMRLMAGPVGHYFLKSTSELFEFENYDQKFSDLTYGWQAGIGVDLLNIMVDIRYEGNFTKFGDHIVFSGQQYSFANAPARLIASLAVAIK
ncbi:MAG: PorT family protein [Saprospiraceae bacterium]|nr:PorT family protein [Saprospiraceae bacterium]